MLKNKKILIIFLSVVLFMFILNFNTVEASSSLDKYTYPEFKTIMEEKGWSYWLLYERNNNAGLGLIISKGGMFFHSFNSNGLISLYSNAYNYMNYHLENGVWVEEGGGNYGFRYAQEIYFTNYDVISYEDRSTVFFQQTLEGQTTMSRMVILAHPEELMKEIVKILPLILVVVVSLVGLRKAWRLLSNLLHQA